MRKIILGLILLTSVNVFANPKLECRAISGAEAKADFRFSIQDILFGFAEIEHFVLSVTVPNDKPNVLEVNVIVARGELLSSEYFHFTAPMPTVKEGEVAIVKYRDRARKTDLFVYCTQLKSDSK